MITVRVDAKDFTTDVSSVKTMSDLIELIKVSIDPDSIITSMSLEGRPMSEADWQAPLNAHRNSVLEITTGDKQEYLVERLGSAEHYLTQIIDEFSRAGDRYQNGAASDANSLLATAVDDLLAFVNWYLALLSVEPVRMRPQIEEFNTYIQDLQQVCEQLLQQQMFQSWWALGETLRSRLDPQLSRLKTFCEKNAQASSAV